MGRADSWLDRNQQKKDSYRDILAESMQSVNVYRHTENADDVGFKREALPPNLLGSINARIDSAKNRRTGDIQDSTDEELQYVGLTDSVDVVIGDIWATVDLGDARRFYKVVRMIPVEIGFTVWLKEVRKLSWPLED